MLNRSRKNRAQIFSGEFFLSYFIFLVAIALIFYLWDTTQKEILRSEKQKKIYELAVDLTERLVRTRGYPSQWNYDDVHAFGLANESRILEECKIYWFVKMLDSGSDDDYCVAGASSNYEACKYLLGLKGYDMYMNVTNLTDHTITVECEGEQVLAATGRKPVDEDYLVLINRKALLDGEILQIRTNIWD
ncbi:MAG: hypothetical protein GF334_01145 [Candidatus Altiarchaeales archaeon]|nr:hypothetical protein [Candidatus Altiarchaeales archaeon]